jgi:hypothetical protein
VPLGFFQGLTSMTTNLNQQKYAFVGNVPMNDQHISMPLFSHPAVWDTLAPIGVFLFWNQKLINKLHN